MISSKLISVGEHEAAAMAQAVLDGELTGTCGSVAQYETELASWFGVDHALACSSGTAAIYLALRAAGVDAGDTVAVSALGATMSAQPVLQIGAQPHFVDTAEYGSFRLGSEAVLDARRAGATAVVAVSMWGYPAVDQELRNHCDDAGLTLIDDAAQAHGSESADGLLGTTAHIGCFSTHARKLLATGEGGFVLTNESAFFERMFRHRTLGQAPDASEFGRLPGTNHKLAGPLAAAGREQLGSLQKRVSRRAEVSSVWAEQLATLGVAIVDRPRVHNGYGFAVLVPSARLFAQRLHEERVCETDTHRYGYKPIYHYPAFASFARHCPKSEATADRLLVVPCHEAIREEDIERVVAVLRRHLSDIDEASASS